MPSPTAALRARRSALAEIARLDPEVDDHRITSLVLGRVFSDAFFHQALFSVAYWRQTAVETIAPILARRGRGDTLAGVRKRNDDTLLFFGLIYRDGHRSAEGTRTIDRLAKIHKTFDIPMDDYRYTIATLCFEPVRLPEQLGIDALTAREQRAMFLFWRQVGREWGVDIPEEQAAFRRWFHDYERRTYKLTDDGIAIAKAMERAFTDRFTPGPLREVGSQFLRSLADEHLLASVGMQPPHPVMKRASVLAVRAYLNGRRLVPGPARDDMLIAPWTREYGHTPDSSEVGPTWARNIQAEARAAGCPM
jgi:hypothetical protein